MDDCDDPIPSLHVLRQSSDGGSEHTTKLSCLQDHGVCVLDHSREVTGEACVQLGAFCTSRYQVAQTVYQPVQRMAMWMSMCASMKLKLKMRLEHKLAHYSHCHDPCIVKWNSEQWQRITRWPVHVDMADTKHNSISYSETSRWPCQKPLLDSST